MGKRLKFAAPGSLVDYAARKHKLNMGIDPSPAGFLSRSQVRKDRVLVKVGPGGTNKEMAPIEFSARVKSVMVKLEDVTLADDTRLGDIIYLVNDDKNTAQVVFEADPEGDLFDPVEEADGKGED